jgi:hypothetical protein
MAVTTFERFSEVSALKQLRAHKAERTLAVWIERELVVEAIRRASELFDLVEVVAPAGEVALVDTAIDAGQRAVTEARASVVDHSTFIQARVLCRIGAAAIEEVFQSAIATWVEEVCQVSAEVAQVA